MARIDDYILAKDLSKRDLSEKDINKIASFSGARLNYSKEGQLKSLCIRFLNRDIVISWPDMEFSHDSSAGEVPIQEQVLVLHYMNGVYNSGIEERKGEWISYQDLPEGRFYLDAFLKRGKEPLIRTFGENPRKMVELASRIYGASSMDYGDFSVKIMAFPIVPVVLVLWRGDDEFPAEGNILFEREISRILSAEDIAWLSGMVVYPLVGMMKKYI